MNKRTLNWFVTIVAILMMSISALPVAAQGAGAATALAPTSAPDRISAAQTIVSLGLAGQYAAMGQYLHLHNTDIFGDVGVGYTAGTPYNMQVESPGFVHGVTYKDPSATITGNTGPANLQGGIVTQAMSQAFADAMNAYNTALTLTPDYTINGDVKSATTVVATHGGQYVVRIAGDISLGGPNLIFAPMPGVSTKFIVILEGTMTLGGSSIVGASTAAGAKDVLIVVKGTGTDMTSHINNIVNGTMLAPYRGAQFHGFNGAFIGGVEYVKFMSDCQIHYVGYEPAAPFCLGEASNFGILGTNGGSIIINSSTSLIGDVGYSMGVNSTTNQKVSTFVGTVYVHSLVSAFNYTPATFNPSGGILGYPTGSAAVDAKLDAANLDALAASNYFAGLPVDVNLGNLGDNDNRTVNRVGPVTVAQIGSWTYNSDVLTLVGQAGQDDAFVINVLGNLDFSQSEIRLTNVRPEMVVFNFPNSSSTILIDKSATIWNGVILAPTVASVIYHNPATFNGAIIANGIAVHSDFNLTHKRLEIPCGGTSGVVGDFVWDDLNGDGLQDAGEPGIPRVTVTLYSTANAIVGVTTTDASGHYSFTAPAGEYYLLFTAPANYDFTLPNQGVNPALNSDAYPADGQTAVFALLGGGSDLTWDAGLILQAGGRIGDRVWNDANGNGVLDTYTLPGGSPQLEPGIAGAVVALTRPGGSVITTTTTITGYYQFLGLTPGQYSVDVSQVATGYFPTTSNHPQAVSLATGQSYQDADFGYAGKGLVSGVVFYDWDQDGAQGPFEDGIPNVAVCLYRDGNRNGVLDAPDTQVACQNSGSQGEYAFTNQLAGAYIVKETPPAGVQNTTPTLIPVSLVVVGTSGIAADNNYGHVLFAKLGDFVYLDLNANGRQDPLETTGLAGVPLQLTGTNIIGESVNWTGVTGSDGRYLVDGLLPGTYIVTAPPTFSGFHLTSVSAQAATLDITKLEDLTLDFGYIYPTVVGVQQFGALVGRGRVELSWQALGEPAPLFHVWRADNGKGIGAVQVTAEPVAGGSGAYRYADTGVAVGQSYWYWLEDAASGQRFGPQTVTVRPMVIGAYLPLMGR